MNDTHRRAIIHLFEDCIYERERNVWFISQIYQHLLSTSNSITLLHQYDVSILLLLWLTVYWNWIDFLLNNALKYWLNNLFWTSITFRSNEYSKYQILSLRLSTARDCFRKLPLARASSSRPAPLPHSCITLSLPTLTAATTMRPHLRTRAACAQNLAPRDAWHRPPLTMRPTPSP